MDEIEELELLVELQQEFAAAIGDVDRSNRLGRSQATHAPIVLAAEDVGRAWTLSAAPDASSRPAAGIIGPAEALALLLWRRIDLDDPPPDGVR